MLSSRNAIFIILFVLECVCGAARPNQVDIDSGKVLKELSKTAFNNAMKRLEHSGSKACNKRNVKVFREWYCTLK
jgi:hypothetical protein